MCHILVYWINMFVLLVDLKGRQLKSMWNLQYKISCLRGSWSKTRTQRMARESYTSSCWHCSLPCYRSSRNSTEYNKEIKLGLFFLLKKVDYRLDQITKQQMIINYSKFTRIKNKERREEIYFRNTTTNRNTIIRVQISRSTTKGFLYFFITFFFWVRK